MHSSKQQRKNTKDVILLAGQIQFVTVAQERKPSAKDRGNNSMRLFVGLALLPAIALEEVAVIAGPRIGLGADLLVGEAVTGVVVVVSHNVVDGQQGGEADHA
jgi:hypothetical protein